MMVYLGLFAPVLERLVFVAVKVAIDSRAVTWPALYMPMPSNYFSNFPLQVILLVDNFDLHLLVHYHWIQDVEPILPIWSPAFQATHNLFIISSLMTGHNVAGLRSSGILVVLEIYDLLLAGVPIDCLEVLLFVQGFSNAYKNMVKQELIH
ncbi:hypothetical protein DSO57_1005433 [Entomophthora muscae]|uniref:Uncharacterized protein n=1 Tax=Entomophthora muscae TaxID=34485 RepID=A0ACC2SKX5_9FUNG|nr:hypothetical protein DSO57_1005433 [Entomophthora muscae]